MASNDSHGQERDMCPGGPREYPLGGLLVVVSPFSCSPRRTPHGNILNSIMVHTISTFLFIVNSFFFLKMRSIILKRERRGEQEKFTVRIEILIYSLKYMYMCDIITLNLHN